MQIGLAFRRPPTDPFRGRGTFSPRSHAAYFRAVQSRSCRHFSKSASVRLDRNTAHAAKNAARALSKGRGGVGGAFAGA